MRARRSVEDPLRTVQWRDLLPLSRAEEYWELFLSLPWLAGSLIAYHFGYIPLGLGCAFFFFLTGLRQSHGAQHYTLGFSKRVQDLVMFALSASMLASMHAVQASHLHHHRRCMEDDDAEGATAKLAWWQAMLIGPLFVFRLHQSGWRHSGRKRPWIVAELLAAAGVVALAAASPGLYALRWHVAAMLLGECLTGFFAVWTVHHGCDSHQQIARTQRGRWVNRLFYSMFFHAEHHLYPQVPTCRLHLLADRLDAASADFAARQVMPLRGLAPRATAAASRLRPVR